MYKRAMELFAPGILRRRTLGFGDVDMEVKKKLVSCISEQLEINFLNLETALKTYDREALVCGAPAWRYAYHTIHSCDKWLINPFCYTEPEFHISGMDNPDNPCGIVLTDYEIFTYFNQVKKKSLAYIDSLNDEDLYKYPTDCKYSVSELILGQFRHMMLHTGMLNGQTIEKSGNFPIFYGLDKEKYPKDKLYYD